MNPKDLQKLANASVLVASRAFKPFRDPGADIDEDGSVVAIGKVAAVILDTALNKRGDVREALFATPLDPESN